MVEILATERKSGRPRVRRRIAVTFGVPLLLLVALVAWLMRALNRDIALVRARGLCLDLVERGSIDCSSSDLSRPRWSIGASKCSIEDGRLVVTTPSTWGGGAICRQGDRKHQCTCSFKNGVGP